MRIAVLTRDDLFPTHHGAAVKIVKTAEALRDGGDDVFVVTGDRDAYWRVGPTWTRVAYGPRLRAMEEWPGIGNEARARRMLSRLGYPEDEHLLYQAMVDPAWWLRALYVGVRERVQAWHAEFPGYAVPAILGARLLGGRSVATAHNVEWDRLRQTTALSDGTLRRLRRVEAAVLSRVDRVVAVSDADRARLGEMGVTKVSVVPLGVDVGAMRTSPVDVRARYGIGGGPLLFFHGTLHYGPNADALRWIAAELMPRLPAEVSMLVVGMNPPRELASDRMHFTGAVDDLAAHIAAADLCVCPLSAGGGTRLKLLEYFAAGKAVVSTPLGAEGLRVADDEELALAELPAFADAVVALLGDPERRRRLAHRARAYAGARDWQLVTPALRRVLAGEPHDFAARPSVEDHLPPRTPSKPLTLLFLINRGCNLRCSFCDLWEGKRQVPLAQAEALFADAAAIGTRTVVLTGGEPLLHPQLPAIVRAAKGHGMAVNVTTNGTLLDRHYATLVAAGVDSLSFSLDGREATHDRLRGQAGAWQKTWSQMVHTVHDGKMDVAVYFVVTKENVRELVEVYEMVRAAGARFDFWPVNDAPDLALTAPEDQEAWLRAVEQLSRVDSDVADKAHYYAEALRYHRGEIGAVRCLGLVDQYGVTYDGELLPCCVWGKDGLAVGNVFQTPLRSLWTRADVQAARRRLWSEGCTVGCYNHSLYELTTSTGKSHRIGD